MLGDFGLLDLLAQGGTISVVREDIVSKDHFFVCVQLSKPPSVPVPDREICQRIDRKKKKNVVDIVAVVVWWSSAAVIVMSRVPIAIVKITLPVVVMAINHSSFPLVFRKSVPRHFRPPC